MGYHISGSQGDIAETVLLPGDPLRAKYIAENFLSNAVEYNKVRNMLGYTGFYKGQRISVQGTGMGMPSISIYATELIRDFGVQKLLRVGTCGAMQPNLNLRDIVVAQAATTDSSMIRNIFGSSINFAPIADYKLLTQAVSAAKRAAIPVHVGNIISVDRFYDEEIDNKKLAAFGILAVEMETAALYLIAAKYNVKSLGIFTVSDNLLTGVGATSEERETSFNEMIQIALAAAIE